MGKKKSTSSSASKQQPSTASGDSKPQKINDLSAKNIKETDVKTEEKLQDRKPRNEGNYFRKNLKIFGFLIALLLSIGIYSYQDDVKNVVSVVVSATLGHDRLDALSRYLLSAINDGADSESRQTFDRAAPGDSAADPSAKGTDATDASKPVYSKKTITNQLDNKIRSELDKADAALEKGKAQEASDLYDAVIAKYPNSPRAVFGKANALNKMAEEKQSNALLEESINKYLKVLSLPDLPKALAILAGKACADRQSFRGWGGRAVKTMKQLIDLYPDELLLRNDLGVKYLMIGRVDEARNVFIKVLDMDPANGFAMVHLGFILKTTDKKYKEAIPYLRRGIESNMPGVIDGRFFFHLGDALFRTGQHNESHEIYKLGAEKGVFPSFWQRSLYNVDGLTARPWWTKSQSGSSKFLTKLEQNWEIIRDEGLMNLDEKRGVFELENEDLREEGDWRQFTLYSQGRKHDQNCKKAPKTCALLEGFTEAVNCKRGQIKYSVMQPGVHVWPHCGPTNCRIRSHLGLVIPDGARIRIANETRTWKLGEFIIFDDSFEHEVWHDGTSLRLVFIIDMWHPELTSFQKQTLAPI